MCVATSTLVAHGVVAESACEDRTLVSIEDSFRKARIDSVRHMAACEKAKIRWAETGITEIVISRAAEAVTVRPFTQPAESISGADWIWWWIDSTSAYGMLVQAKRLTVANKKWRFDFDYPDGAGIQRRTLMSTAATLGLTPVYALYLGTSQYRNWKRCPELHRGKCCVPCTKRSVSMMPAVLADPIFRNDLSDTYERSVALEELWTPATHAGNLLGYALGKELPSDLFDFLSTSQTGARAVSRAMIERALRIRMGQFARIAARAASATRDGGHDRLGPVFPELPTDSGHWGVPYFEQILAPLQHVPPDYVLEFDSGSLDADDLASSMPESVAGVVIVRMSPNG